VFGQDKTAISATEAACGPRDAQFTVKADETWHPIPPTTENGKALIYEAQKTPGVMNVSADSKWFAA
jgi:hypothetical protein